MFDSARIHAASLSALVEFVNREFIVLRKTNPKLKLSHSQALEYVARLQGYNTYKGLDVEGFRQKFSAEKSKAQFDEIFNKQFKSVTDEVVLARLKAIHKLYMESQQWVLDEISDMDTAVGLSSVKLSKWNEVSGVYLQKNLSASEKWHNGGFKPQLELSHLFTANLLGHLCTLEDDEYIINEDVENITDLISHASEDEFATVLGAYNGMACSCLLSFKPEVFTFMRTVEYLMAVANKEESVIELDEKRDTFELFGGVRQREFGVLKNMAIKEVEATLSDRDREFALAHNIPNVARGGQTYRFLIDQLPTLNSTIIKQDYQALKYCPENMSLNLWNELLINFYNAALDFSHIVFENHVINTRFSFHNIYFDQGGRICFKTMDKVQVSVDGEIFKLSANDFNMWFTILIGMYISHQKPNAFNTYMSMYYQILFKTAIENHTGLDKPKQLLELVMGLANYNIKKR